MNLFSRRSLSVVVALALATQMHSVPAAPTTHTGSTVQIDFDPDTFAFQSDGGGGGGGIINVDPSAYTVNPSGDSVAVTFGGSLYASASSYFNFNSEDAFGSYSANFGFSALPGHVITGYQVTFEGTYDIESPGFVEISGSNSYSNFSSGFGTPWSQTETFFDTSIPALLGSIHASGQIDLIDIPGVFQGYEQIPNPGDPDCTGGEPDDGVCGTVDDLDRPIFDPPPRTETDLGLASINVNSITITAQTAPVPEPSAIALAVLGLAGLAWRRS
jgi:hypothetical protein